MIDTKVKLKGYLSFEKKLYQAIGYKGKLHSFLTKCEVGMLYSYIYVLRHDEFFSNTKGGLFHKIGRLYYRRKHNLLGIRLGISIPINTFEKGLLIYHSQGIIVHKDARCGSNCKLHGMNCIGNNGKGGGENNCPVIGDNLDLGVGAIVIGNVHLGDNTIVAANAVVCKSFDEDNQILAGVPAKIISSK